MAGTTVDTSLITQFSAQVHVDSQQVRARTRPIVITKMMTGDLYAYDGLGLVEATEINSRYTEVDFGDIEHKRRKIQRHRYAITLPIDASDVRGQLLGARNEYSMACVRGMERRFDRTVIEALDASVETGRDFGTTVTSANDGVVTVNATAGLTYEKILELNKNFINADVGNDLPEKVSILLTGDETDQLMKETELTSGDFSRQFVVDKGRIVMAVGNVLIPYGADAALPMLAVASTTRDCFAVADQGVCVGMSKDITIKIEERNDLYETDQVKLIGQWGAVRTEGVRVQKLQTTTS